MTDKDVNTGGGTFVGEDVNTGSGDFVGRDKTNTTNNIENTSTTSHTYFNGNSIVAVAAVLVVGIIGSIAILPNLLIEPAASHTPTVAPTVLSVVDQDAESQPVSIDMTTTNTVVTPAQPATQTCRKDNPVIRSFQEENGEVTIDAKNCSYQINGSGEAALHKWEERAMDGSCSGTSLRSYPNDGTNTYSETIGPAVLYDIIFQTTGDFFVYVRGSAGESYTEGDQAVNDSILIGVKPASSDMEPELVTGLGTGVAGFTRNKFSWQMQHNSTDTLINIPEAGEYTLYVWMREDGVIIDRIWLSTTRQTPEDCNQIESSYS